MSATEIVGHLVDAARLGVAAAIRETGGLPPPYVEILAEDLDQPYAGRLTCRPFYVGADAVTAIAGLGVLPSQLAATRLLVVWEVQDLNAAVGAPVDPDGSALVALDATFDGHTAHWFPLRCALASDGAGILTEWGTPSRIHDRTPPIPIARLLDTWRQIDGASTDRRVELDEVQRQMDAAGYSMRWVAR